MRWIEAALPLAALAGGWGQQAAMPSLPPQGPSRVQPRFVVVLDAAHGGSDTGARLGNGVLEKNLTLQLANELGAALRNQGTGVIMTRQSDTDVPMVNRAEIANHAEAAACLVIHATATGSGVHLFASSLSPRDAGAAEGTAILPWQSAQAAYITQSLRLESELDEALTHDLIPVTLGRASVEPMDSLACPTVAVELAPLAPGNTTQGQPITDEQYDGKAMEAVAAGIAAWRDDWKP